MKYFILTLIFMFNVLSPGIGQAVSDKLGLGFNLGGQLIYGDGDYKGGFGIGLEGYLKYKMSERFHVISALGYGELSDGTFHLDKSNFTTNMITLDVKGSFNLTLNKPFQPFLYLGVGAFNFQNDVYDERYNDFSVFIGGGFEYKINPFVGLTAYADYRYTTSEALDNRGGNDDPFKFAANDGYLNVRGGFTYYFKAQPGAESPKVLAERAPLDEIEGTAGEDKELDALIEGIENYQEASSADFNMEEYIRLKSKVDQLSDAVRGKEMEIDELKTQLESRKQKFTDLQQRMRSKGGALETSMNMDVSDFPVSYEEALENFYAREFDAAIYMFTNLIAAYPDHRLANNCQYWIGECHFGKGEYDSAIEALNKVFDYESPVKKDDALLMLGRSYMKQNNLQLAKTMFDRLLSEYPDSEYANHAGKYVSGL